MGNNSTLSKSESVLAKESLGVRCPKCRATRFRVVYTRHRVGGTVRVKECKMCGHHIRTQERVESYES